MARHGTLVILSLAAHGALAAGLGWIEPPKTRAATAVELASVKKKKAEPPKPPPPPKIEPPPQRRERRAVARPAAPPPEAPPPPQAQAPIADLPDFGVSLSGGIDGTGIALPVGGSTRAPQAQRPAAPKPAVNANPKPVADECSEPLVKPKLRGTLESPNYTDAARAQGIEGKVRVELTVDESGQVVSVRVLQGLGFGLDEAALAAARKASFEPAQRCGKPSRATLTIAMRFSLS